MTPLDRFEAHLRWLGPLDFPPSRAADLAAFPPMVTIYRDLCRANRWLPVHQRTFAERVAADVERDEPGAWPRDAVLARAYRTFPSLVRQHHLAVALHASRAFEVSWIPWLDWQGIDLLCLRDSFAVGVALSVDTEAARFWQTVKEQRTLAVRGLVMLRLDARPRQCRVGAFYVHPPADVQRVVDAMRLLMFAQRTAVIPDEAEARAVFEQARRAGAFSGKPGWTANGLGYWRALSEWMRQRAADEGERQLHLAPLPAERTAS